jgi:hypothetical protein
MVSAGNATAPSTTQTVTFDSVQNPTSAVGSFYMRLTTFSDNAWTTAIDTGTVVGSTATQFTVSADVAESLTFCVGATWSVDCAGITGSAVTLSANPLTTAAISTGTSEIGAATNGTGGFVITYIAGQFTCSAPCSHNFTNGFGTGGSASAPGTEEFGLKAAQISGSGGSATAPYNAGNYAWNPATTATQIASSSGAAVGLNRFTVTYGANVSPTTNYGSYSTVLNYVCTPSF